MWRIKQYKKIFEVEGDIDLKELKKKYRSMMKDYHPDKFLDEEKKEEAGIESQKIIEAFKFLVSIAPDTKAAELEEYTKTITQSKISDYDHKGMLMEVTFSDGNTYEFLGVSKNLFGKFNSSDIPMRFAKRNIFNTFIYRKSKKAFAAEE